MVSVRPPVTARITAIYRAGVSANPRRALLRVGCRLSIADRYLPLRRGRDGVAKRPVDGTVITTLSIARDEPIVGLRQFRSTALEFPIGRRFVISRYRTR
ncbi:hypothetical protein D8S78_00335 [Natrialba swarupiae]|nr:hypothetical protein [Natrialba swarupiae]